MVLRAYPIILIIIGATSIISGTTCNQTAANGGYTNIERNCGSSRERGPVYVENDKDYPLDELEKLLKANSSVYENVMGEDVITDGRKAGPANAECFCESIERVIFPRKGQDHQGDWYNIINHGKFRQGIRIEECMDVGKPCHLRSSIKYPTECRQLYAFRSLLAKVKGRIQMQQFEIPNACKCFIKVNKD
ncbi:unnamed protein product [Hermetia illucens]|uniref:Spaetzle domain-containing protein n=1 Tax=Hermetia illucens TaxID=343691 RepID=A0A7R8Z014_HERIL|nr:protein spaetzle-like isoform X1 [Hermetia illucens]CAD7091071.1 unnamed protein product [Hermetia illucens]